MNNPRPFHEWHEDHGDVIWWLWPIEQAPWVGAPLDIGRTVSFDITVQIGIDVYEVQPQKVGDTGGWPWADADDGGQDFTYVVERRHFQSTCGADGPRWRAPLA